MAESNDNTRKAHAGVRCVEVLVSPGLTSRRDQDLWPLSVYSLENHAVKQHYAREGFEVFHFMVYDWERTIEKVLVRSQVPYSVIQYFIPDRLYPELSMEGSGSSRLDRRHVDGTLTTSR